MVEYSLIVLAKTDSEFIFKMNEDCFNTFIKSIEYIDSTFEIILIESNEKANYVYSIQNLKIITPKADFNFHKFLNIGIKEASGNYYILSNNDVKYTKEWLANLQNVAFNNPKIESFSPYDQKSNKLPMESIKSNSFILGYQIQKHLTGWCIIMHKNVINKIKKLDEKFNFYYADFDYAMQLQKYNIKHALVTKAIVNHLESVSYNQENNINYSELPSDTPKYLINENWTWILKDKKMVEGVISYHKKWGSRRSIKVKLYAIKLLKSIGLGFFSRFILTTKY